MKKSLIGFLIVFYFLSGCANNEEKNTPKTGDLLTTKIKTEIKKDVNELSVARLDKVKEKEETKELKSSKETQKENIKEKTKIPLIKEHKSQALQTLDKMYKEGTLTTKLLEYDKRFKKNDFQGDITSEELFEIKKGSGKVLISAPHTTKHEREDYIKVSDRFTGANALLLQELTGVHLFYTTRIGEDANYIIGGKYKNTLKKYIDNNGIELVLDIHGMAARRPLAIDLGTSKGLSLSDNKAEIFRQIFQNNKVLDVGINEIFTANYSGTVTNFTYKNTNAKAVQIEINRNFGDPAKSEENVYRVLKSLIEIIEKNK